MLHYTFFVEKSGWNCYVYFKLTTGCPGKSGLKLFIVSCIFASILDFAELVHFILVLNHTLLHSYLHH